MFRLSGPKPPLRIAPSSLLIDLLSSFPPHLTGLYCKNFATILLQAWLVANAVPPKLTRNLLSSKCQSQSLCPSLTFFPQSTQSPCFLKAFLRLSLQIFNCFLLYFLGM